MRITLALLGLLALGACARPGGPLSYNQELAALEQQCTARDGTLQQLRNPTVNPATDYVCRIREATTLSRE
jgi:hypothetical protein